MCLLSLIFLGISYSEYENLCQKKIDVDNQMEEKRVRDDELRKVCPYVDCNILNARTLCPDQCIGSKLDRNLMNYVLENELYFNYRLDDNFPNAIIINILENSSEAGIWYHTPGVGEDLIITHTLSNELTFCKVDPPGRISQSYVHLAYPANTVYRNILR